MAESPSVLVSNHTCCQVPTTEPPLAGPHERWCGRTGASHPLLPDRWRIPPPQRPRADTPGFPTCRHPSFPRAPSVHGPSPALSGISPETNSSTPEGQSFRCGAVFWGFKPVHPFWIHAGSGRIQPDTSRLQRARIPAWTATFRPCSRCRIFREAARRPGIPTPG